jgi:hypothetical protein
MTRDHLQAQLDALAADVGMQDAGNGTWWASSWRVGVDPQGAERYLAYAEGTTYEFVSVAELTDFVGSLGLVVQAPPPPPVRAIAQPVMRAPFSAAARPGIPGAAIPQKRTSAATASIVFAILWLGGVGSLFAILLGFNARGQIKRSRGAYTGRGLAAGGLLLGFVGLAGTAYGAWRLDLVTELLINKGEADRIAQGDLMKARTAALVYYLGDNFQTFDYRGATPEALKEADPSVTWVGPSVEVSEVHVVSTWPASQTRFIAATQSRSGKCWFMRDTQNAVGDGTFAELTKRAEWTSADDGACRASAAPDDGWIELDVPMPTDEPEPGGATPSVT